MKGNITRSIALVVLLIPGFVSAQVNYRSVSCNLKVQGTSNTKDWEMTSTGGITTIAVTLDAGGKPSAVTGMNFTMGPTSLKSGKESMENTAYKAMKTADYAVIKFEATFGTVTPAGGSNYTITCPGVLTIAGKAVSTDLTANCTLGADGSLTCTGVKSVLMTDFGITPPSFMMGSISTGNEVKINFNTLLKK